MIILLVFAFIMITIACGISIFSFINTQKFPIDLINNQSAKVHLNNFDVTDIAVTDDLQVDGESYIDTMILPGLTGNVGTFTQDKFVSGFDKINAQTALFSQGFQTDSITIESNSIVIMNDVTTTLSATAQNTFVAMKTNKFSTTNNTSFNLQNVGPESYKITNNPSDTTGIVTNKSMDCIISTNIQVSSSSSSSINLYIARNNNVVDTKVFQFDSKSNIYTTFLLEQLDEGDTVKIYLKLSEDDVVTIHQFTMSLLHI